MSRLAARAHRIGTSATMQVALEADRLRRSGADVVDLSVGEPDFPTPAHVKAAAHAAIDADLTKYTANAGLAELRQAICDRCAADYGVTIAPAETIATAGGKQALYNAVLALFGPGDEVITHAPGWPTLVEQIKLADATPVVVRTYGEDGFAFRASAFVEAIGPRTRGIVLNTPCNPTGAVFEETELAALATAARDHGLWVVVDLCYERLVFDARPHDVPRVLFDIMRDRTVLAGSASKAYAMTGWRCGWAIAAPDVIAACNARQSHSTSNVSAVAQRAAIAALTGSQDCVASMLGEYRRRRDLVRGLLTAEPRIRCAEPAGAFYLFLDVGDLLSPDGIRTSSAFAEALLAGQHLALTPGEAFDAPGYVRLSFAASEQLLREGIARLRAFVETLDRDGRLDGAGR
jgi:aspartate aminotransferase